MTLEPMNPDHVDSVVRIEKDVNARPQTAETFLKEIDDPSRLNYVTFEEEVRGYIIAQIISDELHIDSVVVDEKYRRQGLATVLVDHVLSAARSKGATSATLEVRAGNDAAISLYKNFGFRQEGMRSAYYADNVEDALIMWNRDIRGEQ